MQIIFHAVSNVVPEQRELGERVTPSRGQRAEVAAYVRESAEAVVLHLEQPVGMVE